MEKTPRAHYKPVVLDAATAHKRGMVQFDEDGTAHLFLDGERVTIPITHQFDLTQATIFGLNERLTMAAQSPVLAGGQTLRERFNDEWERYSQALEQADGPYVDYGAYAYYANRNHLVRFADPYWHRVVVTASTSMLYSHADDNLRWEQVREKLSSTVVAVAGCSVGSNVIHAVAMDLRPTHMKIADKSMYKLENVNRVRVSYWDMVHPKARQSHPYDLALKNKAQAVADQLYSIDPYMEIALYDEGISEENIAAFFDGSESEPPIDILVEEVDDPRIKVLLREEARLRRIPVVMVTDAGSAVQLDVMRYDLDPSIGLAHGITDEALREAVEAVYTDPGNRERFFTFVDRLIGTWYRQDELDRIISGKSEVPTSTIIPQMGSTAAMGGGIAAEAIARIRLGYTTPRRVMMNKHTFTVQRMD